MISPAPTPMEEYLFDLRGYSIIENALDDTHLTAVNEWISALPAFETGQVVQNMEVHSYGVTDGFNLQNIIEGGEIFERLIDHPAWIGRIRHYCGTRHRPYIHEVFLNLRGPGGFIGLHSGGHIVDSRKRSGRDGGQWCSSYLTVLLALTDVGSGDGATVVVPGSHKSSLPHPSQDESGSISPSSGAQIEGGHELHIGAGGAILINDYLCHGSVPRTNDGQRRMIIFRYVPEIYTHRWGYVPSAELLARVTPAQREIIDPVGTRQRVS